MAERGSVAEAGLKPGIFNSEPCKEAAQGETGQAKHVRGMPTPLLITGVLTHCGRIMSILVFSYDTASYMNVKGTP